MISIQQHYPEGHIARSSNRDPGTSLSSGPGVLIVIIFGAVVGGAFLALFSAMYKQWRWERRQSMKKREEEPDENGKPELPGESSSGVHEMGSQGDPPELGVTKDGPPHELPWKGTMRQELPEAEFIPQELPASVPQHEMPDQNISQIIKPDSCSGPATTVQTS
ncbi:hypothetical protein F5Y18DRAFT_424865 [Xylariaceae sp. FL1019]|nr:hypothetical protein F5Y18DRAFT_424865 [Xylariaceae sp. FL1019]